MHIKLKSTVVLAFRLAAAAPVQGQSVRDLFRQVNRVVMTVYTTELSVVPGYPGSSRRSGDRESGVLISGNREVLTAAHMVQAPIRFERFER